jgi:hypothetical protein
LQRRATWSQVARSGSGGGCGGAFIAALFAFILVAQDGNADAAAGFALMVFVVVDVLEAVFWAVFEAIFRPTKYAYFCDFCGKNLGK